MQETMEEKQAVKFSLRIWSRLFPYFKEVKKHMLAIMIFMVASALTEASYPLFTRYAVNNFVMTGTTRGLFVFAALFLAFILFEGITVIIFSRQSIKVEMFMGRA
jgi:ATP-binding cassette subfamily B protein